MTETVLSTNVGELLREAVGRLTAAGVTNAVWEAREMMAAALGESPALVPLRLRETPHAEALAVWERLVAGRAARKPLAQVLGEWDFDGMRLVVTPDVLTPRPETEEFLGWSAARMPGQVYSIADVGTGSGCLAIALARRFPGAYVWGVDASAPALNVARSNARALGAGRRLFFLEGDLLSRLSPALYLDAVVANLPYVDRTEMPRLPPEVLHEPALALDGGEKGLEVIRRLVVQAWERLVPGGRLFLEVGHDQGLAVATLLREMGYNAVETGKDFAGIERFVMGVR